MENSDVVGNSAAAVAAATMTKRMDADACRGIAKIISIHRLVEAEGRTSPSITSHNSNRLARCTMPAFR
jgi:hypothetical protein